MSASVIWHEAECGSYSADLSLWEELAQGSAGSTLDIGCGTGRVALYLARRGHRVHGLDIDRQLVGALRKAASELPIEADVGDARDFALGHQFGLVVAPMQLVQLLAGAAERERCLRCASAHLRPGGLAAFAIVETMPEPIEGASPPPDAREVDGWVYSSLPVDTQIDSGAIRVRRLRQTVSPQGDLAEELYEVDLRALDAPTLEEEADRAGLRPAGRRLVPPTDAHVGSTVVLLEREA